MKFIKRTTLLLSPILLSAVALTSCATTDPGGSVLNVKDPALGPNQSFTVDKTNTKAQLAFSKVQAAAIAGDPDAEYALGYMYFYGNGGAPKNPELARSWINKAAAQGQPQAIVAEKMMRKEIHPKAGNVVAPQSAKSIGEIAANTARNVPNTTQQVAVKPATSQQMVNSNPLLDNHFTQNQSQTKPAQPVVNTRAISQGQIAQAPAITTPPPQTQQIMQIPSDNYTLQLLGSFNRKDATDFMSVNGLQGKAQIYQTVYQGKPWFVVIYGQYPSRQAAQLAIASLPINLQKQKPWIESFAAVKKRIAGAVA